MRAAGRPRGGAVARLLVLAVAAAAAAASACAGAGAPSAAGPAAARSSAARPSAAATDGRLEVRVVASGAPVAPFRALPVAIVAIDETGAEIPLRAERDALDADALAAQPERLAAGAVTAGLYRGLRVAFELESEAGGGALDARLERDFRVLAGETATLVVRWDLARTFDDAGRARADALALELPPGTVRSLTLYVTDERAGQVVAVNRATDRVFASIPVGRAPRGIAASPDGRRVYVANSGDDSVTVLDTTTHRAVDTLLLRGGSAPVDVAVALDGRRLVVSSAGLDLLSVHDAFSNALVGEIELSRAPGRLAVSPDGRTVYALLPEGGRLVAADVTRPDAPVRQVAVAALPEDVAVDPRDGRIYVAHRAAPTVGVYRDDLTAERELQVGYPTYGIAVDPAGRRLYVTGGDAGGVNLVAADVGATARRWSTGPVRFVAVDPDGRKLFATGGPRGMLVVLDRIAGRGLEEVEIGSSAFDLVVVP